MSIFNGIAGNRGHNPIGAFIHNDAGSQNANAVHYRNWLPGINAENGFAHDYVCSDGIVHAEDDWNRAWHCGNTYGNNEYYSVEVCQSMGDLNTFKSNEEKALALVAQKFKQYGITPNEKTVRLHKEVSATACPHRSVEIHGGDAATKAYFIQRIKELMNNTTTEKPIDPDGTVNDKVGTLQEAGDKFGEVSYKTHVRAKGWLDWTCDGNLAGSTGQSRRVEALMINPVGQMDISVHMKNIGDKTYKNVTKDTVIGTTGEARRIEALKIDSNDTVYSYRVHQKTYGWSDWCVNGQWAGVKGKSKQIEAIEIKVVDIAYKMHVQGDGWTDWVADGMTAGTTGESKRAEAIMIKSQHCGDIKAKAHIQSIGWEDYGVITENTIIGTTGESKRLECLQLNGNIQYRMHIQGSGWTSWTDADGVATLGTVGQSIRAEAIQIKTA